jgi:hypothetical protein
VGTVVVVPTDVSHTFSNPVAESALFVGLFRDPRQKPVDKQGVLQLADVAAHDGELRDSGIPPA